MIPDGTLGGYLRKHERPPAFLGSDGQSYSVDTFISEDGDPAAPIQGALLFVRWSSDGAQPVGHVETEYLTAGSKRSDVKATLLALPLPAIKEHLDRAIARAEEVPDW